MASSPHNDVLYTVLCSLELRSSLFQRAFKVLRNEHDAEDAVQETLLRAFNAEHSYDARKPPLPWLFTIARNVCLDALRMKRREFLLAHARSGVTTPCAAQAAMSSISRLDISKSVAALPIIYKNLVLHHDILGYSKREIAAGYGIPYHTVRTRLARGRRILQSMLVKNG